MLRGEVTNTNFTFFVLNQSGIEPPICRTRGEHANHYTSDAVNNNKNSFCTVTSNTYPNALEKQCPS
jgi:hypothetical protein